MRVRERGISDLLAHGRCIASPSVSVNQGWNVRGRSSLSKNLIPDFSTNSRNPGPHPNRSAQTSMIAIGFLAALKRAVMSSMTCWRTGLVRRLFSCSLEEEVAGRGGAECG